MHRRPREHRDRASVGSRATCDDGLEDATKGRRSLARETGTPAAKQHAKARRVDQSVAHVRRAESMEPSARLPHVAALRRGHRAIEIAKPDRCERLVDRLDAREMVVDRDVAHPETATKLS